MSRGSWQQPRAGACLFHFTDEKTEPPGRDDVTGREHPANTRRSGDLNSRSWFSFPWKQKLPFAYHQIHALYVYLLFFWDNIAYFKFRFLLRSEFQPPWRFFFQSAFKVSFSSLTTFQHFWNFFLLRPVQEELLLSFAFLEVSSWWGFMYVSLGLSPSCILAFFPFCWLCWPWCTVRLLSRLAPTPLPSSQGGRGGKTRWDRYVGVCLASCTFLWCKNCRVFDTPLFNCLLLEK